MKLSQAANRVIELARSIREYYAAELPKRHPNYPLVGADEESAPPPPEEIELRHFLEELPDEFVYQLALLMYLGRGDFAADELAACYDDLKRTFVHPQQAASQMIDKAPLADYLGDGLEAIRQHGIDVDKLPLKKVKVRKQ